MRTSILLAAALLVFTSSAFAQSAKFRGANEIGKVISARVMADGTPFSLSRYKMPSSLVELMGTWNNRLAESTFRNGDPNPLSMLVWYLNLESFAKELGAACAGDSAMINAEFSEQLKRICKWPASDAKSEEAMQGFWLSLMGYDAPESEYRAWREFFLSPVFSEQKASVAVTAMTFAIVMNPHFLLEN